MILTISAKRKMELPKLDNFSHLYAHLNIGIQVALKVNHQHPATAES
jgi:hypothetical protein